MSKITVAYWSGTGNTEAMAEAVGEGIKAAGKECAVVSVSDISASDLEGETSFALGCPAMGAEVLEEGSMEPFVEEVEKICKRKKYCTVRFLRAGAMVNGCVKWNPEG